MSTKTAVLAIKAKGDKASIKSTVYQVTQMVTACVRDNIQIIDCAISYSGGIKSLIKDLKLIDSRKRFDFVIVYSPMQIAKDPKEFAEFREEVETEFKCELLSLRTG